MKTEAEVKERIDLLKQELKEKTATFESHKTDPLTTEALVRIGGEIHSVQGAIFNLEWVLEDKVMISAEEEETNRIVGEIYQGFQSGEEFTVTIDRVHNFSRLQNQTIMHALNKCEKHGYYLLPVNDLKGRYYNYEFKKSNN